MTAKVAEQTAIAPTAPPDAFQDPSNRIKARTLGDLLGLTALTFGAGAGFRGLMGLRDLVSRTSAVAPTKPRRSVLRVPYPVAREEMAAKVAADEEKPANCTCEGYPEMKWRSGSGHRLECPIHEAYLNRRGRTRRDGASVPLEKKADPALTPDPGAGTLREQIARPLARMLGMVREPGGQGWGAGQEWLYTHGEHAPANMPWAVAGNVLAPAAGLASGYMLTDHLLGGAKTNEEEEELARAKTRYERALLGQHATKAASAGAEPLDALAAEFEKGAYLPYGGGYAGTALTTGLLSALLGGAWSYNHVRSNSTSKAVEEALKRRHAMLYASAPRPIEAKLVPVVEEEEEAEDPASPAPLDKAAMDDMNATSPTGSMGKEDDTDDDGDESKATVPAPASMMPPPSSPTVRPMREFGARTSILSGLGSLAS